MSYEVFARKWRPLSFDEIVGQDHITRTLKRAVESDRISHAYLLSGPRGCGKTSTARILARVINCENLPGDGNPCNACTSCAAVIAGNNLDVMEIDGASHTGVDEVRDLQESIGYAPSRYRNKVYVIDEVHMLSTHAFNALLKTLEEPPARVYFVFATTAPQKIPDTIKSRCQRHHFKRLEVREIAGQLARICDGEGVSYDQDGLRLLARKADGSMRDGTSLLDQCVTSSGGNVNAEAVRDILGLIDRDKIQGFMRHLAGGDATAVLRLLDECIDEGLDINELGAALLEGYRDLMVLAVPGDLDDLLFRSNDELSAFKALLDGYELGDLVTVVERLCNALPRIKTSADPRVLMESLLVDLSLLDRQVEIRRLIDDLEGARNGSTGTSGPRDSDGDRGAAGAQGRRSTLPRSGAATVGAFDAAPRAGREERSDRVGGTRPVGAAAGPCDGGPITRERLEEEWKGFVDFIRQKRVSLGVALISGRIVGFDGRRVVLGVNRSIGVARGQIADPSNAAFLGRMLKRYFGCDLELACAVEGADGDGAVDPSENGAGGREEGKSLRGVSEASRQIVARLKDAFDGEIVR